jgi:hypothetical protein
MKKFIFLSILSLIIVFGCKNNKSNTTNSTNNTNTNPPPVQNVLGYNLLNKVKGIWNGPVTSTTPLGSYTEWIVDFRPISENQISSKNELDTLNSINMSFFIALYNNQYKVAFRNGGQFNGADREAYFLVDSVSEVGTQSYYRFSEIVKGKNRAYTEVIFNQSNSLTIKVYTNKNNSQPFTSPHMTWTATLQDTTACMPAVTNFGFPKKTMTKDFSTTFVGVTEAIYYQLGGDPYPESAQPYLGKTTAHYSYASGKNADTTKKTFLVITTQPLINGATVDLKHRSRYVILSAKDYSYTFNYMHPGAYYLYALYDADGNGSFNTGDWMNNPTAPATFTLSSQGTTNVSTQINFTIP